MSEWRTVKLGEIADVFDGPHATPKKTEDGPWFLSISSLSKGRLDLSQSAHLSEEDFLTWTRRVTPQEGDVLFSYETRLGEAAIMPAGIRACLGRRMGLLRPKLDRVDPRFLLYAYLSPEFQEQVRQRSVHGATVDRIPISELPTWDFRLPNLRTQQAVASTLGVIDDKIALNDRIHHTAEQLAIDVAGQAGVTTAPLVELVESIRDQVAPPALEYQDVALYSIPAYDNGRLSEHVSPQAIKSGKLWITDESVLVSKLNPRTPRAWLVGPRMSDTPRLASTEFLVLRPIPGLTASLIWAVCSQSQFWDELMGKATGTSNSHQRVRPADLLATDVVDPRAFTAETQGSIDALCKKAAQTRLESRMLAKLRDALLPGLMSGEIRVRDAERAVEAVT